LINNFSVLKLKTEICMAVSKIGNSLGALVLGEIVGMVSEEITNRVRQHRPELGGPSVGAGSGRNETLADLTLDSVCNMLFLMMGINFASSAFPPITEDLASMIMFILGLSTQTTLPRTVHRLTTVLMTKPDPVIVPNAPHTET
jgi:hypothetical protein